MVEKKEVYISDVKEKLCEPIALSSSYHYHIYIIVIMPFIKKNRCLSKKNGNSVISLKLIVPITLSIFFEICQLQ